MLKQRVITALVLLAVLLPALFAASPVPFMALTLLMVTLGAWEWGRLSDMSMGASIGGGVLCASLCGCIWVMDWIALDLKLLWILASAVWVLASAWLLRQGVGAWGQVPPIVRWFMGITSLCLAWTALVQARGQGISFLLSILALVWVADISAYFAGRAFGLKFTKSKLAPSISPGKSWEGVWGGVVGVMLLAMIWVLWDRHHESQTISLFTRLANINWLLCLVAVWFMTAMSVVGDLVESLIKRSAGVKDSSHLLPGHGGVLDRVDALLPTLPIAMLLTTLVH